MGAPDRSQSSADMDDAYGTTWLMTVAVVLLGVGSVLLDPNLATIVILGALAVAVTGLVVGPRYTVSLRERNVAGVVAAGIIVEGLVLASLPVVPNVAYQIGLLTMALIGAHATFRTGRWRRAQVAFVLAGHFLAMCWMLASTAVPPIDVIPFQQESAAALLQGVNPYAIWFDNIFGQGSPYYSPELQVGDQLAFGFMYPPLSLLLTLPGYVIAGDYRYGAVAAVTITAALVAFMRPHRLAIGAAMLIVFAPLSQVVLYWGWTEPFVAVMLAATTYFAVRSSASTPVALGLLIAAKQYCAPVLLIGFFVLKSTRNKIGSLRMVLVPLAVAAITVIPFAIWDLPAFVHSAITMQILQPFRLDALTIPAQLARAGLEPTPPILGFVLGLATLVVLVLWIPRTVANFCYATAVFFMVFFLFNKHAFVNYYFFVLVAIACGVASTQLATRHRPIEWQSDGI